MPILRQKPLEDPRLTRIGSVVGGGGGAPAPAAAPAGPVPQGVGSFVNLQQYLAANQGQGSVMADKAFGGIENQAQGFDSVAMPTSRADADLLTASAQKAGQQAGLAGSWGGRDTQLANTYGKGAQYDQGERNLDNALMGGEAGNRLSQLSSRYSSLANKVFAPASAGPGPTPVSTVPETKTKKTEPPVIRSTYGQNKVDDENERKRNNKTSGTTTRVNSVGYDY